MTTTLPLPLRRAAAAVLGVTCWLTMAGIAAAQDVPEVAAPVDPTAELPVRATSAAAPDEGAATSLELSKASGIDPAGEVIAVTGHGFTAGQGVYVMFCVEPAGALGTEAGRADTCNPDQSNDHTVWKTPIGADGTFVVDLRVEAGFESTDCTTTTCGVFVRRDHMGGASDYSQDAFAPVSFASVAATSGPAAPTGSTQMSTGSDAVTVQGATSSARLAETGAGSTLAAAIGVALLGVGMGFVRLGRRSRSGARA